MKKILYIILFFILSCSTTRVENELTFTPPEPPDSETSLILFYRVENFIGSVVDFDILRNRKKLGNISESSYLIYSTKEDIHNIVIRAKAVTSSFSGKKTFQTEPGNVYYVKIDGMKLKLVNENKAIKDIKEF